MILSDRERKEQAAYKTLAKLGYTWFGRDEFEPPIGKAPKFAEGGYATGGYLPEAGLGDSEIPAILNSFQGDKPHMVPSLKKPVAGELSSETLAAIERMGTVFADTAIRVLKEAVTPPTILTINPEGVDSATFDRIREQFSKAQTVFPAPEGEHVARDGYEYAFYKLADLLGLGAQVVPASEVFETQMYPQIKEALEAAATPVDPFRWFRMQHGPAVPWEVAEVLYAGYAAAYGTGQSIERMNERGGFGWGEIQSIMRDQNYRNRVVPAMRAKAKELGIGFSE